MTFPAQKSRTAFVVDEILRSIREGLYRVGDQLPPERILAEQLGVGRAAVREAFSALQIMNIIERRIGNGTYIQSDVDSAVGLEDALAAIRENESLLEVWTARKIIEIILAELAVQKATQSDLEIIRKSLTQIEQAVNERDCADYEVADRDFHLSIAKAAKNPFLMRALLPLIEITHHQLYTCVDAAYIELNQKRMLEQHQLIFSALEKRQKNISRMVELHFCASDTLFLSGTTSSSGEKR
jgi:DNA-binding FadR family transcriptional regulator